MPVDFGFVSRQPHKTTCKRVSNYNLIFLRLPSARAWGFII